MFSAEQYANELDYLVRYAHDDWVGFSVISGTVGGLLGRGATMDRQQELALRIVGDLLSAGARAGDLTASDETPFAAWEGNPAEVLARIAAEVRAMPGLPDSGDICWFTVID
ncbi:hypothetical protein G3I60_23645 [Streptomyces sp. SID13666]|uniref:hypothetical protein n=1 Tax=Streptomyces TaxID=1883 RepID=UPI001107405B|nr:MULTISPECIES: hypothetical protein [Streptomyces]MCZ4096208.1 hypothetical protein [Streptomyces sp. H39-C1]NEA57055.1 hypothetical protein [Streptomyces sp. SID13666]NEA74800.1 hypothetical protein [Streptomyces sp. SID13588]QNA72774.1 hypothetical protein C8250_013380 [Streptomyces sp. So13.3]